MSWALASDVPEPCHLPVPGAGNCLSISPARDRGGRECEAKASPSSRPLPLLGTEETTEMGSKEDGQPTGEMRLKILVPISWKN